MSNKPIAQVAISTIKTATKQDIYPKTTEKAVVVTTTDPDNGSSTTLDKVIAICKDKEYSQSLPNGLGRHVLKKNIVNGNNILTSDMLSTPNTEYYIQYDFNLNSQSITLPTNSTLYFMGGSLKNGTLVGNNTRIVAPKGSVIFDNVTIEGTWDVEIAWSSWFKTHKAGYKIKSVTEAAASYYRGSDKQYHDFEDLTEKTDVYFVKSTLTQSTYVNVNSVFFMTSESATFYKGSDNVFYNIEDLTLVSDTYYVTSSLDNGSVVEGSIAITVVTKYKCSDGNYYEFNSSIYRKFSSINFVTDTLDDGAIVEDSVFTVTETYAFFKVAGGGVNSDVDYVAAPIYSEVNYNNAPSYVPRVFNYKGNEDLGYSGYDEYIDFDAVDDTVTLQNLFDLRAKKTVLEDGVYMIRGDRYYHSSRYNGLYIDSHKDSEIVLEGWLKVIQNSRNLFFAFHIINCENLKITGHGGIQGDLLEHLSTSGEAGMNIVVANSKNLTIESITTAYAWGDCIYSHWWTNGRPNTGTQGSSLQMFHTYKNVNIIYGGRTGYACEHADNVIFDSCYFYGTGRIRGKSTYSAIDIEPFNYGESQGVYKRYVKNYEFKNNVFDNSYNGLRLERCVNASVHDNKFDFGVAGVDVIWHTDVSYNKTTQSARSYLKSHLKIYDNFFKRCTTGIHMTESQPAGTASWRRLCENVDIYGNTFVNCQAIVSANKRIKNCRIYDNTSFACGGWKFESLEYCDIYNNTNYACKMNTIVDNNWGDGRMIQIGDFSNSINSKFHNNVFTLDYNKPFYGLNTGGNKPFLGLNTDGNVPIIDLGVDGGLEYYHGLPVGYSRSFATGVNLNNPSKIHFYDNRVSDDFYVLYSSSSTYQGNGNFTNSINSLRNENSSVFLVGDTFRSETYGDEGVVTVGGIIASPQLEDAWEFEAGTDKEVAYGEIIKVGDIYKICKKGGRCGGETFDSDEAEFLSSNANIYMPDSTMANRIKIRFKTKGKCSSSTRPSTFLYEGRRMWETDTNCDIVYDGLEWDYEYNTLIKNIVEVSGTTPSQELAPSTYYNFTGKLTSLTLTLGSEDDSAVYKGQFTSADNSACSITLPASVTASESNPTIAKKKSYKFKIKNNIFLLKEYT